MDSISSIIGPFPYFGLFLLLILGGLGFPFPEDATLILCGFLISHKFIKPVHALITVYAGLLTADIVIYSLGRRFGRAIITHKRFHRFLSPGRISRLEEKFDRSGYPFILFGRHVIGFRAQVFLVAGIMKMPIIKFISADAVSALFTLALMIGIGYAGGNSLQALQKDISRIEHIAVVLGLTGLAIYLLMRYFRQRREKPSE